MRRKELILSVLLCLLSFTACSGQGATDANAPGSVIKEVNIDLNAVEEKIDITIEDIENLSDEILEVYGNSSWFGFDNKGTGYGLKFENNNCSVMIVDKDGNTKYDKSISIDPSAFDYSQLIEYKAIDLFSEGAKCQLLFNGNEPYFRLESVYLSKSDINDINDIIDKMNVVSLALDYIDTSKCWIGCKDDQTCTLKFDDDCIYITYMQRDGDFISKKETKTDWNFNFDSFSVYNDVGIKLKDYNWRLESEGDLKILTLISEDEELLFYELDKASMEEGNQIAIQYLSHRIELEQLSDMSKLLEKYEGVSIVDGLVSAGVNPSYENRKVIANTMGLEAYKGTAEQNLALIELLGGKIK